MRSREQEWDLQQFSILNAEYEELKEDAIQQGKPRSVTVKKFEIQKGLKRRELANYRANHIYRENMREKLASPETAVSYLTKSKQMHEAKMKHLQGQLEGVKKKIQWHEAKCEAVTEALKSIKQ